MTESCRLNRLCRRRLLGAFAAGGVAALLPVPITRGQDPAAGAPAGDRPTRLVVRADDMGAAQAINEACVRCYRDGVVRSVEVIVPGPWFPDAVRLLKENPGLDVGVHLCLTSEWDRVKWGPLTHAPSLADGDGYFYPMTRQRADFPPNTGFVNAGPKLDEVGRELRAQIETAVRHLGRDRVSHVSAHMGAAVATPELRAVTARLAREHGLRLEGGDKLQSLRGAFKGPDATGEQQEQALAAAIEKIGPGDWMVLEHPGLDTPEMRAIGHKGYENVATHRAAVTQAFTSERVKKAVEGKKVRLISYAELD